MKKTFVLALLCAAGLMGMVSCKASVKTSVSQTNTVASKENIQAEQSVTIGGSGTAMSVLKILAEAYEPDTLNFLDSSQASAGIAGVKEGYLQIGTVTRKPKAEEQVEGLSYQEVAQDAILVATHQTVTGVKNLTTDDLKAIYSGEAVNWQEFGGPDAEIVLLDRPEDESAKRILRTHQLGAELPNSPNAVVLRKESELVEALQNTEYSIGAFSLAKAVSRDLPVNHMAINGVEPTAKNVEVGDYPMVRHLGIVWFGEPTVQTQSFMDFSFGDKGADVMRSAGLAPTSAQ